MEWADTEPCKSSWSSSTRPLGAPWTESEIGRWEKAKRTFSEASAFAKARGISLVLVYVPIKFRVYRGFVEFQRGSAAERWGLWPLPDLFADFCLAEGLPCVDLTEPLRTVVGAGGHPYPSTDTHWSAEGHALVATYLEGVLRSRGLAPPRNSAGLPRRHQVSDFVANGKAPRLVQ